MAQLSLEERMAALERQVADIKATIERETGTKDWRSTLGMFSGNEMMKEIDEEARKIREADRRKARRATNHRRVKVKK